MSLASRSKKYCIDCFLLLKYEKSQPSKIAACHILLNSSFLFKMLCNGTDTSQKVWYMEPQSAKYCFSIVSSVLILQHVTEPLMLLYTLPDDTVCNIATNSDNVTVNSTDSLFWFLAWVTWSTGDWSFRHCALGVGSGCLILIMSKISLIFSRSVNFDAIGTKMDRSLLDKKSFFRMRRFFSFTKIVGFLNFLLFLFSVNILPDNTYWCWYCC